MRLEPSFLALLEAAVKVKQHVRKSKSGKQYIVHEFQRKNPDRPMTPTEVGKAIASTRHEYMARTAKIQKGTGGQVSKIIKMKGAQNVYTKQVADAYNWFTKNFPAAAKALKGIEARPLEEGVYADAGVLQNKIVLNSKYLKMDPKELHQMMLDDEKDGISPKGSAKLGWKYILAHEFGHQVLYYTTSDMFDKLEQTYEKASKAALKKISTTTLVEAHEFFAEAFANLYFLGGKEFSVDISQIADTARRKP